MYGSFLVVDIFKFIFLDKYFFALPKTSLKMFQSSSWLKKTPIIIVLNSGLVSSRWKADVELKYDEFQRRAYASHEVTHG